MSLFISTSISKKLGECFIAPKNHKETDYLIFFSKFIEPPSQSSV